ncbi:integral membrane protein [Xylaria palmicola]|nr:integral membrane protein [Xylaria palmicola]
MDAIKNDLPMAMTMAAFAGISWYIGAELNISLFLFFKQRRGLYFWSCALVSWGVILQSLFIILADFGVWTNLKGSITLIYLSWLLMVIPQSWVLYSRLHLLMQHDSMLRWVRAALIFTSLVFGITTIPLGILAQTVKPSLHQINVVWDRLQTTVFFVQETVLSVLYIWQTRKYLADMSPLLEQSQTSIDSATTRAKIGKTKTMLHHLLYINILIISLDIALLGVQYANLFYLQGAFKPAIYGVKLKLEFVILNRLIKSISRRKMSTVRSDIRHGSESDAGGISLARGWNTQWPSSATEDERHLKTPHVAHHSSSIEYLGDMPPLRVA